MISTILFITMVTVFLTYIIFIWSKYGVQTSISESYYVLSKRLHPLFTFFCWGCAIPAIILGSSALMFFAGAGIAFVGAATQMHEKFVRKIHVTAAIAGITFGHLAIIFQYNMWWLTAIFIVLSLLIIIFKEKNYIWWIEIMAFLSICYALGTSIF